MENKIKELEEKLLRKEQECKNNKIAHQMELDIYNQECLNLLEELKAKEQECETLASQLDFEVQKKECLERECEELKHNYEAIKQCNDNNMQTLDEAIKKKEEAERKLEKVEKQYKCYSCGTCNGKEDYYNLAGHHENAIKSLHKAYEQLDQLKKQNDIMLNSIKKLQNKLCSSTSQCKYFLIDVLKEVENASK